MKTLDLTDPWEYFSYKIKSSSLTEEQVDLLTAPFGPDEEGIALRWQSDLTDSKKLAKKQATGFDLRYNAHISPSEKDWRDCYDVLSLRDFGTLLRQAWEK